MRLFLKNDTKCIKNRKYINKISNEKIIRKGKNKMIKLEIKIKEDSIQDFDKVTATALNITMKEKEKKSTLGEQEALKLYKKVMGFDNNLMVVNRCKNQDNFEEIKAELIREDI